MRTLPAIAFAMLAQAALTAAVGHSSRREYRMFAQLDNKKSEAELEQLRRELHPTEGVQVRIGLVGVGAVASVHHIPGIRIDPRAALVAICDPAEALLKQRAEEWGPVKAYTKYDALVEDPDVDTVIISTPNNTHVPIALACIKKGKNVMCEKPLGVSAKEAQELYLEAEKAGVVHMTAVLISRLLSSSKYVDLFYLIIFLCDNFLPARSNQCGRRSFRRPFSPPPRLHFLS